MAELVQPGGGGSSLEVSDGSTSVFNVSEILFTGATVSNGGAGTADVLISASATSITVGSTLVGSASDNYILYNNAGTLGQYSVTGTGTAVVLATSPTFQTSINGAYLTASTILITDSSSDIISATTATYPSLTELSYVKGVTSAIQTQINAKGAGTVTAVSVATANGFSGSSSGGSTPALTIVAGAITPTSVNSVVISGSSTPTLAVTGTTTVSGSNTGDQTITLTGNVTGSGTGSFAATIQSSVPLAGSPTTTTQSAGDNSTKIATTAYADRTVANGTGLVEQWGGNDINSSIGNNTYTIMLYAEYGMTINELKIIAGSGTCTAAVKIGSTAVTGISAVSVSNSIATGTATAANTVSAGNTVTLVLSSTSSLTNLQWTLKTTRT